MNVSKKEQEKDVSPLAKALEELRVKMGSNFAQLAKRIGVSRSLIHSYVRGNSTPTLATAVKLGLLETSLTNADKELTCRRWIELAGRKTPSEEQLRGMVSSTSPFASSSLPRKLENLLAPLFKRIVDVPPDYFMDLVVARVSQARAEERWIEWQKKNPKGTVLAFWEYEGKTELKKKAFGEKFFKEILMNLLNPPAPYRKGWPDESAKVDIDVMICLILRHKNGATVTQEYTETAKADIKALVKEFIDSNPEVAAVGQHFSIWINSIITPAIADRWIFFGVGSNRGLLLETVAELGKWVPESPLKEMKEKLPLWMYASVEMPEERVKQFWNTRQIKSVDGKLEPDSDPAAGWLKIYPSN